MEEINCKKILEKHFPLVIADEDEWAIECVKAMQEACKLSWDIAVEECKKKAKVVLVHNGKQYHEHAYIGAYVNKDSIEKVKEMSNKYIK